MIRGSAAITLAAALFGGCAGDSPDEVATESSSPTSIASATPTLAPAPTPSPTIDTTQPFWYVPYLEAEAERPFLDGTVAGVRVSNAIDYGPLRCPVARWEYEVAAAAGTALDLDVRGAVAGSTEYEGILVGVCADGDVAIAEADFSVLHGSPISQFGGNVRIFRHTGEAVVSLSIPEVRWSEMDVAGETVGVATPVLADLGLGQRAVVAYRDGVVTLIHTTGISLDGLLLIAKEILR